jgi:RING-finger-containing E3 ubiquitin ligase
VNRQYLRLTSALLPLRLACSGGKLDEGQFKSRHLLKNSAAGNLFHFDLDDGTECSICLQSIEDPIATNCSPVPHIFCKECIEGVFSGVHTKPCPCCRNDIKLSEIRTVVPTSAVKNEEEVGEDTKQDEKPSKKRNQELKDSDILFRSKFECLLKELIRIRDEEPECKLPFT